ncbi:MAG: hypothetical protein KA248_14595 [Kiritimatiellae bacterium]|nr:hypothetical protein [Kiritimatiellia bacterium]
MKTLLLALGVLAAAQTATGQEYRQLASVHDAAGGMSDNTVTLGSAAFRHVGAAGQPGGIGTGTNGPAANHSGFLQAADLKRPNLDTDGDGVPDELDEDNDGDRLADRAEVEGSAFDPATATIVNNPDSDGDHVGDGDEAAAGTNPGDDSTFLQIVDIRETEAGTVIAWTARDGKQYRVLSAKGSHAYPTREEAVATAHGGQPPWFETIAVFTNTAASTLKTFAIQALP